ncbi:hypothetical protein [Massilia sp. METH4]|uniref:hypothetical protein n=1 Tax=Massilia sp. METH4 TaxID=3123041 RepID=UPI0030D1971D
MNGDRRADGQQARVVDAAIRIDAQWGCVSAWQYLRARGIAHATAARVLGKHGARRAGDAVHPAVRDALERQPETGIAQRSAMPQGAPARAEVPRTNVAAALAVERAIGRTATHGRHYAESLLRMYSLNTATVMRVLFEPHRRRRRPQAAP